MSLSSHENDMSKISIYKTFDFLRQVHLQYVKCLLINIQNQQNMLKIANLAHFTTLKPDTSNTSVTRVQHKCDTNNTRAKRVLRKRQNATRVKNFNFVNDTSENIFSHRYIGYIANERLQGEEQCLSKYYLFEMPCSHAKCVSKVQRKNWTL